MGQIVTICGSSVACTLSAPTIIIIVIIIIIILIIIVIIAIIILIITCMRSMVGIAGEGEEEQAVVRVPKLVSDCVSRHARLVIIIIIMVRVKMIMSKLVTYCLFRQTKLM